MGFGGTLISFFALAYAVAWSLWIPLAILRDRVPSPLGFVLLAVPPAHLIGTVMGCRTVPVAIRLSGQPTGPSA
jgi:hypothetical protein